jgi:hypothetical protein
MPRGLERRRELTHGLLYLLVRGIAATPRVSVGHNLCHRIGSGKSMEARAEIRLRAIAQIGKISGNARRRKGRERNFFPPTGRNSPKQIN